MCRAQPWLAQLEGIVDDGFFCYPVFERDSWFDPLPAKPAFTKLLARCKGQHRAAVDAFDRLDGRATLGLTGPRGA